IYMSFVLRPTGRRWADAPTLLTIYAAVSVCRAIEELTKKEPKIKWVNDIFLDGKKICGILTEAVTDFESGSVHWAVVGIGINFKPAKTGLPEELKKIVGSVFEEDKASLTRNELAANIINHMIDFEAHIGKKETLNEYKKRLMMLGEKITVVGPKETYEAIARDIDDAGRLIVEKENGEIVPLFSGEIKIGAIEK
ncbi:MAG: biotin--[acetyl-CoA-carboxylase] ligase, partial [Oscillospiraceae bacterium]|nr:biotin--[acetyl-CoA-carboxylase] ligase [Oscillospiraceae bacterium]